MKGLKKRLSKLKPSKITLKVHHNRAFFREQENQTKSEKDKKE